MIFTHKIIGFQPCTRHSYSVLPSILEAGNYLTWPTFKKKLFKNCMRMFKTWVPIPFIGFLYLQDIRGRRQLNKPWFWKGMLKRFLQPLSLREARSLVLLLPSRYQLFFMHIHTPTKRTCISPICTPCIKFMTCLKWSINSPCSLQVHYPGCPDCGQEMLQTKVLPFGRYATCKVTSHRLF